VSRARKTLLGLTPVLALGACSVPALLDRVSYGDAPSDTIELACGESFDVVENQSLSKLKVTSGVFGELRRSTLPKDCDDSELRRRTKVERFQKAAREHLDRSGRKDCRFKDSRLLGLSQYEFTYDCGPEEKPKRGKKNLLGR
jgi:hypothetical protein